MYLEAKGFFGSTSMEPAPGPVEAEGGEGASENPNPLPGVATAGTPLGAGGDAAPESIALRFQASSPDTSRALEGGAFARASSLSLRNLSSSSCCLLSFSSCCRLLTRSLITISYSFGRIGSYSLCNFRIKLPAKFAALSLSAISRESSSAVGEGSGETSPEVGLRFDFKSLLRAFSFRIIRAAWADAPIWGIYGLCESFFGSALFDMTLVGGGSRAAAVRAAVHASSFLVCSFGAEDAGPAVSAEVSLLTSTLVSPPVEGGGKLL
mmetsp:Transcript_36020/g.70874  ORF Transcript_36020/g.70874 Transcript_36020/m.70874 type:complete len:266 (-) Transcript_36020:184-981(-)